MVSPYDPEPPYDPDDYTSEQVTSVKFVADLGRGRQLATVAEAIQDVATLVDLGERIALRSASHLRRGDLRAELAQGRDSLAGESRRLGVEGNEPFGDLPDDDVVDILSDLDALPETAGPLGVVSVEYRNPLEIVLVGGAFLLARGLVPLLRLVRDWSHTRRLGDARAQAAQNAARVSSTRADLIEWLARETREGRNPVPMTTLIDMISDSDMKALDRLAGYAVDLDAPSDTDPGRPTSEQP